MKELEIYRQWLEAELDDPDLREELVSIEGKNDEIKDRFYKELEFGTGGLRGVLGAGTNRMNIYTVRKATQGIAQFMLQRYGKAEAAVSFDSRHKSDRFAKEVACVFAANGIKVHLMKELAPTPVLSYAVRYYGCKGGVMVTASHNPAKYNGYKAYGPDGCQMNLEDSEAAIEVINRLDIFNDVKTVDFDKAMADGMITYVGDDMIDSYIACVRAQSMREIGDVDLKIVYTPLNGCGNRYVRRVLDEIGVKDVTVVPEQEYPNGDFTTCPYPNPEIREALQLGLDLSEKVGADLLLATDPDSDRVGVAVRHNGEYKLISGNEMGCMLLDYIASARQERGDLPEHPIAVKTIVTTPLTDKIAAKYGVEMVDVLTGFKFIGEQILHLEEKGEEDRYLFGFEESYGYLSGTYVRDKDAVVASMLICEMADYLKEKGMTLYDYLLSLYKEHGFFGSRQNNFYCEGVTGMERMKKLMDKLRNEPIPEIDGRPLVRYSDYETSKETNFGPTVTVKDILLPKSNVLCYYFSGDLSIIVRPSGTEPKIKVYYSAKGSSMEEANAIIDRCEKYMKELLGF